jgi:hypothetical protein
MRAVVLLAWYVESLETTDPGDDVKVLEGIAAELKGLSNEETARLVEFVAAEAEEPLRPRSRCNSGTQRSCASSRQPSASSSRPKAASNSLLLVPGS